MEGKSKLAAGSWGLSVGSSWVLKLHGHPVIGGHPRSCEIYLQEFDQVPTENLSDKSPCAAGRGGGRSHFERHQNTAPLNKACSQRKLVNRYPQSPPTGRRGIPNFSFLETSTRLGEGERPTPPSSLCHSVSPKGAKVTESPHEVQGPEAQSPHRSEP